MAKIDVRGGSQAEAGPSGHATDGYMTVARIGNTVMGQQQGVVNETQRAGSPSGLGATGGVASSAAPRVDACRERSTLE